MTQLENWKQSFFSLNIATNTLKLFTYEDWILLIKCETIFSLVRLHF